MKRATAATSKTMSTSLFDKCGDDWLGRMIFDAREGLGDDEMRASVERAFAQMEIASIVVKESASSQGGFLFGSKTRHCSVSVHLKSKSTTKTLAMKFSFECDAESTPDTETKYSGSYSIGNNYHSGQIVIDRHGNYTHVEESRLFEWLCGLVGVHADAVFEVGRALKRYHPKWIAQLRALAAARKTPQWMKQPDAAETWRWVELGLDAIAPPDQRIDTDADD